jgi:hypothetical protein
VHHKYVVMERVEDLMVNLQLIETGKKGIKIGGVMVMGRKNLEALAVGKVMTKMLVRVETIEEVLGKIWCPLKGIECRNLDENIFMIMFKQLAVDAEMKLIGEVMEVDAEEDAYAISQFLRIKIHLDFHKPAMRGVTVNIGEEGKEKEIWCPIV